MFGMGFMEIFLIAVVAIIALGPEKLPTAMVEIAKFLKKFKSGIEDAKSTLDNELNISEMKAEAAKYKAQIEDAKSTLNLKDNFDLNNIINDDNSKNEKSKKSELDTSSLEEKVSTEESSEAPKEEIKKESKKKKKNKEEKSKEKEDAPEVNNADAINKFKVDFKDLEDEK